MAPGHLLVDLIAGIAVAQISYRLSGCGYAGVDIGFGGLGAHLFGREEYSVSEPGFQIVGRIRLDVGHIFKVGRSSRALAKPASSITSLRAVLMRMPPLGMRIMRS